MITDCSRSPSAGPARLKNTPAVEATEAVVVLGGTSARLVVLGKDGRYHKIVQIKWEDFLGRVKQHPVDIKQPKRTQYHLREALKLQELGGNRRLMQELLGKIEGHLNHAELHQGHSLADRFCREFANEIVVQMEKHNIDPTHLKGVRFSIAGVVQGTGTNGKITTFNTGVPFQKYPIAARLLHHLPQLQRFIRHVEVLNDGFAGALGELFHGIGKLRETGGGLFIIAGTGVGGAQVDLRASRIVMRNRNEFGKTFFLDTRSNEWVHISLRKLRRLGLFQDGAFLGTPDGLVPVEQLLAGPWMAVNYVKSLEPPALRRLAAELAGRELKEKGVAATRSKLTSRARWWYNALSDLEGMSLRDPSRWSIQIRDTVIRPVNQFILDMKHSRYVAHRHGADPTSRLVQDTWKYLTTIEELWGNFIKIIRRTYPDAPRVVLAGGMAEALGKLPNFVEAIEAVSGCPRGFVQVTCLDGETRESAGVSEMAKLMAKRARRQQPRNIKERFERARKKLRALRGRSKKGGSEEPHAEVHGKC